MIGYIKHAAVLADETARKNYEMYGHPDGKQVWPNVTTNQIDSVELSTHENSIRYRTR